uniref:Marker of proliferation Ki-67 n=1 Tax=Pipistrellus kuhlii TaxID=59472 RepID=A0A7J7VBT2_PIPKU|nr:marker of proliferation Ki-67 [Pipistrellus kuhlii]
MGPTGRLVTIRRSGLDGAHFPLSLSTCLFGRGIECDIRIQLPVVSKQHCKIEVRDQKAVLFNFSAANPTQVNGCAIDGPVQLRHGDVITVIDRSFRYENDSHPDGSKSTEFPGQRCEQKSPRRVSRSSFSSIPDGKVQVLGAARSQVTEEGDSGGPLEGREHVGATCTSSRGSEGPATKGTADAGSSEPPGDLHGNAAGSLAGGFGVGSRVTAASWNGGQDPEKDGENESPFRKLYESMKEELDVKPEKEAVPQNRRKSGSRGQGASESESATQPRVSPKARRRSGRSSQAEAERAGEGLAQTPEATPNPSMPPTETPKAKAPIPCSQQNSSQKLRSGELSVTRGGGPVSVARGGGPVSVTRGGGPVSVTRGGGPVSVARGEDLWADRAASAPRRLSARQQTPTNGTGAGDLGNPAEKVSSRKRRRSLSPTAGVLPAGTDFPKQALPSPLPVPTEQKAPGGAPGLSAVDVSNIGDALSKTEGKPLKRRRVSFGGHLRPELFDENLPPNTPLKRGETPMKRRSLVAHTPPVLKKIIKEQPSEKGEPSGIRSEVATQNSPTNTSPRINDARRRSPKPPASSGSKSPHHTDAPKRGGRRSSSGPARRASVDRSQRGILQTIHSRRRSGASEANLMVSRSWADVVKLSAKQTQTKVVRHGPPRPGPPRPPSKRQRRVNTPKKPLASVHNEFSTGHAASPCTIVIGRAHIEKVSAPARPYRMLNNFVINKKIDFNEDLSGLTEMFKTPAKEKPQTMNLGPTTFSNSEDSLGKKFQVLNSEDKPLLCTPEKFGEKDLNAREELWDKQSSSPAFTQQCVTVNGNMKTPRLETELPKAASSTNKFRRSVELRNIQVTSAECGKDDKEVDTVQNILGRCLRKSSVQTQLPEGEMKERERSFGTCNKNNEPRENSEKPITGRRSRRSSELKCTPRAGLIPIQRWQETECKEDLGGSLSFLQNPSGAEEAVGTETKTLLMHCTSPAPVSTPTRVNTRIKTPSQRANVEDLSDLRKPTRTPGDIADTQKEPAGGAKSMKEFKEAPDQKLDSSENVTGSRRRSRTPRRKAQPIEDMTGFRELFQTPGHIVETVTHDKTTKTPSKSPQPEPGRTPTSTKRRFRSPVGRVDVEEELSALRKPTPRPGETTYSCRAPINDNKDIKAVKETPKQKLDSTGNINGSRRSRTPIGKVQPIEDLVGFRELFQTPDHTMESLAEDKTSKTPSKSPKPEPLSTPTSTKRRFRTPVGKVDMEDESAEFFKETPEQKLDSAKYATGSRRRSRTPRRKVQPMEDLAGFKELFQTPNHILGTVTDDKKTKTSFKSPKSEPVSTPASSKRRSRTSLGKVDVQEALSALRKPTPRPGESTHAHRAPESDDKSAKFFEEILNQELDSAENVTGSRRRSRTPRRKVQPIEDLVGFKELFQTPNHIIGTATDDKIIKTSCKSPKSEPVSTPTSSKRRSRTPLGKADVQEALSALRKPTPRPGETTHSHREPEGDDKGITAFKETPGQKPDSAENVTGSRRRSRTPRRKVQPIEDLAGFKELFQTPDHTVEPMTDDKTKTPCNSPQPELVSTPTSTTRRLRTPVGKMDVEEELSALRKPTPGETTHSHREPEGDDKGIAAFKEAPEQKPDSAENIIGSRRRSRTPKRKVQPIEDLVGFKELFQTPDHIMESSADDKTTKIPCKSQNPEPVIMLPGRNRRVKAPQGRVVVEDELPALRRPTRTLGKTTRSHGAPEAADEDTKVLGEMAEEKSDPAENVTGSKRRPRTRKEKAQPMEDLAGLKDEPETVVQTTEVPSRSPQPEAVLPARRKRQVRAPPRKVDMEEELSAPRKSTRTSARATTSHRAPEAAAEDTKLLEEIPEEKSDLAENVTGGKRRPRTRKEKAQPPEDLAGLKEPLHSSCHTEEPETLVQTTEMPSEAPQAEAVLPARRKRQVRAPPRKADEEEELSAPKKPTRTSARATRSHRAPEAAAEDTKLLEEIPEEKSDPAENATGNKRRPRARKEKAQPPEDLAGLKDEPETAVQTTEVPSKSPQPEAVLPARRQRQLRAPPGKADVEEELSAPRTSGKATRSRRRPADITVFKESPRQEPGPAADTAGGRRQPRSRKGRAQPPEGPARRQPLPQSPVQDEEPDAGTENKPAKPRRVLWAPDVKPVEGQAGRRDPVTPPRGGSVPLAPRRKREDGSPTRTRGLRTSARAQDPVEEKPPPKRQRTAPQQRREPPEPLGVKRRRGAVADGTEDVPGEDLGTKTRGRRAPVATSPGKEVSLRSRLAAKTSSAEQTPGVPGTAGAGKTKRSGRKPAPASPEAKSHSPEDGAGSSVPGDEVRERRACPRPRRRGRAPEPSVAGEKAGETREEAPGKAQEEKEGARPAGLTQRRARKVTVPPAGDTAESQPKPRATRSAKRPAGEARQANDDLAVKKIRTRSRRGREDV